MTTSGKYTVCVLHPISQYDLVLRSMKIASGFHKIHNMYWAQSSGGLETRNVPFQSRVTSVLICKIHFMYGRSFVSWWASTIATWKWTTSFAEAWTSCPTPRPSTSRTGSTRLHVQGPTSSTPLVFRNLQESKAKRASLKLGILARIPFLLEEVVPNFLFCALCFS